MRIKSIALFAAAAAAVLKLAAPADLRAADVTWDNGSGNFLWNTTSMNWTGAAWNNANGDGAIFGAAGAGVIDVAGPTNVNSMSFVADGYKLNGTGPITFVDGLSTWTTGVVNVATLMTAQVNVPLHSTLGFQKIGPGVLELSAPGSFTGSVPLDGRGTTSAGLLVGGAFGTINGGTLRVGSGVIPATTNVSIGTGYLDIGSANVTVNNLTYTNQNLGAPWNATLNANNGVIGSGTLHVAGDITVLGAFGDNSSNTIATNVDLGGRTQVVRVGAGSQFTTSSAMIFSGSLHNGSLLKTVGYNPNGVQTTTDGMALFGNNTYTGPTILNGGQNVIAGTNQTSLIKVAGTFGGAAVGVTTMFGANGSAQNAGTIQVFAGSTFVLDNNASAGNSSLIFGPATPAAQNNDRIRDDAVVQLRDGSLTYRGLANATASESYGSLNVLGGHNVLTITPNGTLGTASLTATGNLSMSPRATLVISGTTLGAAGRVFFNGTVPAADATGILPRVVGSNDFLTYNAATGMTPYAGYAADFNTAGTNVAVGTTTTVGSSVEINALKRTGSFTLSVASGQTLGITSGMILNTSGTGTLTGGTIAFGATPGMLIGTNNISSAITGTAGLIHASGTGTLSGDLSGLSGPLDVYAGTENLNTNTFTGPINVRNGTLNLNVSQSGAGLGAITLGVAQNDEDLTGTFPSVSVSGAGANAVFDRPIIVDNGSKTAAGVRLRYSLLPGISVLNNTTGTQTFNGSVTLNTGLRIQGGGASAASTGATVFNGDISGAERIAVPNGRVIFNGTYSNAGGFDLGDTGFTVKASFLGTGVGNGTLDISGGNSGNSVSYVSGGLQGGRIRVWNSAGSVVPQIVPLDSSTISNAILLDNSPASGGGDAIANVGAGITATWAGPISGGGALTKAGAGELRLTSDSSTWKSPITVSAGTLATRGLVNHGVTSIAADATLEIGPGGPVGDPSATSVFADGMLTIAGGATPSGKLDLNRNGAVFEYVAASPASTIRALITSGYAAGAWTGNGITSSDAAADPAAHAVGYAAASDIGSPATFLGQAIDATSVLVRYTRQGDANLSGTTDLSDFSVLAANFNLAGEWAQGDFDYDGTVGIADFSLLAANFNLAAAGSASGRAGAVPEPASFGLALLGATALLRLGRRAHVGH